mgnify:CR=1 FL=1|jgi:hypothetical protein|tara:strand:- start:32 stop:277 length:246 start_codon:yes stop_codon:yes gene_type:complete
MKFYHYTCFEHLDKIKESGYLKLCESNTQPPTEEFHLALNQGHVVEDANEMKGPGVVWLLKKRLTGRAPAMLMAWGLDAAG